MKYCNAGNNIGVEEPVREISYNGNDKYAHNTHTYTQSHFMCTGKDIAISHNNLSFMVDVMSQSCDTGW